MRANEKIASLFIFRSYRLTKKTIEFLIIEKKVFLKTTFI